MGNPYVGLGTGYDTQGWSLWISAVVMIILAGLFVAARMTQRILRDHLGLDDWVLLASLVSSIILSITEIQAVVNGYGARYKTLSPAQALLARKWFFGAQIAYKVVLMLNKAAICYMYFRIFKVSSKAFRISCHCVAAFIIVANMIFIIGTVFQCTPVSGFWDKTIPATCFNNTAWWMSYAVLQIVLDFVLLALPVREVLKLKMSTTDKLGLILVFATGLFVTFTSIYRATTLARSASMADPTYDPIPATVWTVIEANSGIIAACLPLLRQPFLWLFRRSSYSSATSNRHYQRSERGPTRIRAIDESDDCTVIEGGKTSMTESEQHMIKKSCEIHVKSDIDVTTWQMAEPMPNVSQPAAVFEKPG